MCIFVPVDAAGSSPFHQNNETEGYKMGRGGFTSSSVESPRAD